MQKPFHAIDINLNAVQSDKTTYYRIDDHFYDFLLKCMEDHVILGFAWEQSRNFGVILQDKPKKPSKGPIKDEQPKP